MNWSVNDKKTDLIKACEERGIEVSTSMLRVDLIDKLREHDSQKSSSVNPNFTPDAVSAEKIAKSLFQPPAEAPPEPPESSLIPTPVPVAPDAPPSAPEAAQASSVLSYLQAQGGKVSFAQLIKDCGEAAKEEVKQLVAGQRVIQYRQHNKFWFKAR